MTVVACERCGRGRRRRRVLGAVGVASLTLLAVSAWAGRWLLRTGRVWAVLVLLVVAAAAVRGADGAPSARRSPPVHAGQVRAAAVVCEVFGPVCAEALRVSWCESDWSTAATNGQYLGLFQMGARERAEFGHGSTARAQARAALALYRASGRSWRRWECRP